MSITLQPLGYLKSCFTDKFGIPRQPQLVPAAKGELLLLPPYNQADCVAGLTDSSHVWLSFIFHQHGEDEWKPKVRPPRLGGNDKCGVFASRSSFRPNRLGLSVVKLDNIIVTAGQVKLIFSGVDMLDGTPIVDIKPYIPYADSLPQAYNTFAADQPKQCKVVLSPRAQRALENYQEIAELDLLLKQILAQDPRPAYHAIDEQREYHMRLYHLDITWRCLHKEEQKVIEVIDIIDSDSKP